MTGVQTCALPIFEDPSNILKEHPQTLSSPSNVAMAEPMDRKPAAVDAPFSWSGELASRDPSHEASSGMEEESLFRRVKKAHQRSKLQERQNLVAAANPR